MLHAIAYKQFRSIQSPRVCVFFPAVFGRVWPLPFSLGVCPGMKVLEYLQCWFLTPTQDMWDDDDTPYLVQGGAPPSYKLLYNPH